MKKILVGILVVLLSITLFVWYLFRHHVKRQYGQNGKVEMEIEFNDGKPNGYGKKYYPNGEIQQLVYLKDGKLHGKSITFFKNGNVETEVRYKEGQCHGTSIKYYKNGQIEEEVNYKDGKKDGKKLMFYENGAKMGIFIWKDGKSIAGSTFHENGDTLSVRKGKVVRTYYGPSKIAEIRLLEGTDNSNRRIKFSYGGKILEFKGPLDFITKNDTFLLDTQNPSWRNLRTNILRNDGLIAAPASKYHKIPRLRSK